MRQVVIPRYGGPEVLAVRDLPAPEPGAHEVRIAVRAAGVNFADVLARMGLYPDAPKPPMVVGYEVCGIVDAVGAGVEAVRGGDRVLALTRFHGYSTHVVVPETFVFKAPSTFSDLEAAALPVNYLTAFLALVRAANLASGDTVLIHGAAGGVGLAATQIALSRRATIIGVASSVKHETLKGLGVHYTIDHRHRDFSGEVRRLTGGRGVDVVLDPVGGTSFDTSYRLLAPLGRMVVYGVSALAAGQRRRWLHSARTILQMRSFHPLSLMNRNRGVFGLNLGHLWDEAPKLADAMRALYQDVDAGLLRPVIAKSFPLAAAADAHRFLQARSNVGKVVLTP